MLVADAGKNPAKSARKKARKENETGKTGTKSSKKRGRPKKHIEVDAQEHQPTKRSRRITKNS